MRRRSKTTVALTRVLLMALVSLILWPARLSAQAWSWTTETAAANPSAKFTSIAVDNKGNIHVSYSTDQGFGQLNYAFRPATSSRWYNMVLDEKLGAFYTRVALDGQGNPQICYTPRQTKYAFWDGLKWNILEIAPHVGTTEYSCSLAIGNDGKRHVIWYQTHAADYAWYLHLRHAVFEDGAWMLRTVDFDGEAGKWNSIVLDEQ